MWRYDILVYGDLDEAEALSSTVDSNNIIYAIISNNCDHNNMSGMVD